MSINLTTKIINVDSDFLVKGILQAISQSPICPVLAPTGTGKSTKMVEAVYKVDKSIMFISEPTVPACDNLARRMNFQLGPKTVGTAAEGIVNYSNNSINYIRNGYNTSRPDTRVVYCTIGHLKLLFYDLVRYGFKREEELGIGKGFKGAKMAFCDVLMIDEAHNGSLDNDITMLLYKFLYNIGACVPRLVLASATLDITTTPFPNNPVYSVQANAFPVEVIYHTSTYSLDSKMLYTETAKIIVTRHKTFPVNPKDSDIWLVFCSGKGEVDLMRRTILEFKDPSMELLVAHSDVDPEEMDKIASKVPLGKRRIIIATNIIETSITIEGASGIFDTLTEKIQETSSNGGSKLVLSRIPKSSAEQRKGRTGRTKPGFCYRVIREEDYKEIPETRSNEIERVPLHATIIALMDIGLNPRELLKGRTTDKRINDSFILMKNLGMFSGNPPQVTDQGRFAAKVPLSPYGSACLYKWMQVRTEENKALPIFPALSIIILIDFYGPSYFNYKGMEGTAVEHYQKYFSKYDGPNDVVVLANMWNAIIKELKVSDPDKKAIKKYNAKNSLNNKKIMEVMNNMRISKNYLIKSGYPVVVAPFDAISAVKFLGPIMREVYSSKIFYYSNGDNYKSKNDEVWKIERNIEKWIKNPPVKDPEILGLITSELPGQGGYVNRIISLSLSLQGVSKRPIKTAEGPKFVGAGVSGRLGTNLIIGRPKTQSTLPSLSSLMNTFDLEENKSSLDLIIPRPFIENIRVDINSFNMPDDIEGELMALPSLEDFKLDIAEGSLSNVYDNEENIDNEEEEEEEEEDEDELPLVQTIEPITIEEKEQQEERNAETQNEIVTVETLLFNSPETLQADDDDDEDYI